MKNKSRASFFCAILILALLLPLFGRVPAQAYSDPYIRIGLAYGSSALVSANLENSVGTGYRIGYFDDAYNFTTLHTTYQTQLTMLKDSNTYLSGSTYSASVPSGSYSCIGGFHIQPAGTYGSASAATAAAAAYVGGFPAWINGAFRVRIGCYTNQSDAENAAAALGLTDYIVAGPSATAVTVTRTGSTEVLFQFDGAGEKSLVVMPGQDDSVKAVTWFKGYRYYGCFQYKRMGGGNLTVINVVRMEDYIKGVLPYEMSASWPLEALKAQAVSARTFAANSYSKHSSYGFDLCNSTCCQVYRGLNSAGANSDAAVDGTAGVYMRHNGALITAYYHASDGGATESSENVWGTKLGYIVGVIDPYEADVADKISRYHWTMSYTSAQLTNRLNALGYACSDIVRVYVSEYTPTGNPKTVTFVDSAGKTVALSGTAMHSAFTISSLGKGLGSYRFDITGNGNDGGGPVYVNNGEQLSSLAGVYVADGDGNVTALPGNEAYVIDGSGTVSSVTAGSGGGTSDTFTLNGSGSGHNLGMSQWGAYAMSQRGYTYDQILHFYYTDVTLGA